MKKMPARANQYLAGMDIGGTKIEALLVDGDGLQVAQVYLPMDAHSEERAVISIVGALRQLLSKAGISQDRLSGIGIGIPGKVQAGVVELAVNLKLRHYPLARAMQDIFHVPVFLENDVRTGALGAFRYFRARQQLSSLAFLGIGTGIAAGLILDGHLYRGSNGMAGEIGHIVVEPGGALCACGLHGCLEAVAAGPAFAAAAQRAVRSGQPTSLQDQSLLDGRAVYRAYSTGDPVAGRIVQNISLYLARAIHGMAMAYDVDLIVLGGGVAAQGELFLQPILTELRVLRLQSELADMLLSEDKITMLPQEMHPGVWGAIVLAEKGPGDAPRIV